MRSSLKDEAASKFMTTFLDHHVRNILLLRVTGVRRARRFVFRGLFHKYFARSSGHILHSRRYGFIVVSGVYEGDDNRIGIGLTEGDGGIAIGAAVSEGDLAGLADCTPDETFRRHRR